MQRRTCCCLCLPFLHGCICAGRSVVAAALGMGCMIWTASLTLAVCARMPAKVSAGVCATCQLRWQEFGVNGV